ncbi:GumC family protein [Jannaschia sp. CCS1]|uniref:GumC family protein n=1 Tax=Jannaschia sp. (strain CCS1) TaxID=290400 RepID=UPI000053BF9D|nr:LPS biosynthesis protein [Jannaschia sp. CCS1]ABD57155.1 lipopolysaccharide biosynthesis [Jannaschia sp. CCS1]
MNFDLRFYLRLFIRRLPAMMTIIIVCSAIGVVLAMRLPPTYSTSARLLMESPQIPDALAAAIVNVSPDEEIEIIRQRLLTRVNLLNIANEMNVFENYAATPADEMVQHMRAHTRIRSTGGQNQPTLITVSFEARAPQIAANVVNEYVTRIVSANVELRTGLAEDTLSFFEQEVSRLSTELDLRSGYIAEFQIENADALPDDQAFRLNRQALLQERIGSAERERATLQDQRARVIAIFEQTGQINSGNPETLSPEEQQLHAAEAELANALTIFSETNPQVQLLQRQVERLREQIAAGIETGQEEGENDDARSSTRTVLDLQLTQIDTQITALDTLIAETQQELQRLEDAISRTPSNAITLSSLERNYENIRDQYDQAVARLADASTGERIELTSRGQRISLIESANVPRSPSSPDRPMVAATGVALGIGLAGALFLLLELLNRTVRRPVEITNALGIQPLAVIPYLDTQSLRLRRRLIRLISLIIVILGVPAALWAIDMYYMPLDQLAERVLSRLGVG